MLEEMKDRRIESLMNEYFDYIINTLERDDKTKRAYMINLNCFIKQTGCKTLEDLNKMTYPILQKTWLKPLKDKGLKGATLNQRIATLSSFYEYLNAMEYLEKNPAAKVKKFKTDNKVTEEDLLTIEEVRELVNATEEEFKNNSNLENARNVMFLHLLISTGMRIHEIAAIDISDINKDGSFTTIGKRKIKRDIILNDKCMMTLKHYLWFRNQAVAKEGHKDSLLITRIGTRPTIKALENALDKMIEKANIPRVNCHSFRHMFISNMKAEGYQLEDIAKITGHQNLTVIQSTYHHMRKDVARKLVNSNPVYNTL